MTNPQKLKELRGKIDAIDDQLLALLRTRAGIIEEVRGVKGRQDIYIRPGREALMLKALQEKPQGQLPPGLVHRLWREMISAFTLQEGGLKVAVALAEGEEGFWDLARDHFGGFTPLQAFQGATAALRAILAKTHQLAALPMPKEGDNDGWWRLLLAAGDGVPNVFYRFPYDGKRGNARATQHDGIIAGVLAPEETGADISVLVVEWQGAADKRNLNGTVAALPGVKNHLFLAAGKDPACSWLELEGFLIGKDNALKDWQAANKHLILRHKVIGAYPAPMK